MLAELAFVLITNTATTSTEEVIAVMPAHECVMLMKQVWAVPFETVAYDELGAIPAMDAACVDPEEVK